MNQPDRSHKYESVSFKKIIKELKIGKGGRDMRRAPASVVIACQASTAGEQG